jgi:hypothetical protein
MELAPRCGALRHAVELNMMYTKPYINNCLLHVADDAPVTSKEQLVWFQRIILGPTRTARPQLHPQLNHTPSGLMLTMNHAPNTLLQFCEH